MDIKKTNASQTTKTYNRNEIEKDSSNIYEAISIISKRAEQIKGDIKKELIEKLDEFATYNDSLEEVLKTKSKLKFQNFMKNSPKPHAIAIQEWLDEKIYHRDSKLENEDE